MKVGDKVFVIDWGKHYSDLFKYEKNRKIKVFNWEYDIPDIYVTSTSFHWERIREPRLTLKGEPFKNGETILVSEKPLYKYYKYEILEIIEHPNQGKFNTLVYLLKSKEGCIVQIGKGGLSKMTIEQYNNEKYDAFIRENLNKWSLESDFKQFPQELITTYYDSNGAALFGTNTVNSSIKYKVVDGKYTVDGKPICIGTSCLYDGGEEAKKHNNFITWDELKQICSNQNFQG